MPDDQMEEMKAADEWWHNDRSPRPPLGACSQAMMEVSTSTHCLKALWQWWILCYFINLLKQIQHQSTIYISFRLRKIAVF